MTAASRTAAVRARAKLRRRLMTPLAEGLSRGGGGGGHPALWPLFCPPFVRFDRTLYGSEAGGAELPESHRLERSGPRPRNYAPSCLVRCQPLERQAKLSPQIGQVGSHATRAVCNYCVFQPLFPMCSCVVSANSLESRRNGPERPKRTTAAGLAPVRQVLRRAAARNEGET